MSETIEEFRLRAREWLAATMPRVADAPELEDEAAWQRTRELQGILYDGGFAGICYPKEYGGQGLDVEYQRVFTEETAGYEMPLMLNVPSLSINVPTILDCGTEEQKQEHVRGGISGKGIYVQFLSEPSGGSNLAGVITKADRDGSSWVLNGSKIWSSFGYAADYGMCLARTDWDAPKHRGLTMFIVKIKQPGVELRRIEMTNGSREFCQEFFDDLVLPESAVLGEVNDGWTVATRLMYHERLTIGGGSPYVSGGNIGTGSPNRPKGTLIDLARSLGVEREDWVRDRIAGSDVLEVVGTHLSGHIAEEATAGRLAPGGAVSLSRLFHAEAQQFEHDAGFEIAGSVGVTHGGDSLAGQWSKNYLSRQGTSLGGGSTEMSRNMAAERLLMMPREAMPDKDIPFRDVKQGR